MMHTHLKTCDQKCLGLVYALEIQSRVGKDVHNANVYDRLQMSKTTTTKPLLLANIQSLCQGESATLMLSMGVEQLVQTASPRPGGSKWVGGRSGGNAQG